MATGHDLDRPLGPGRSAGIAGLLAVLMCWPILLTGDVFVFTDSGGYLSVGRTLLSLVLPGGGDLPSGGGAGAPDPGGASFLRSLAYSLFSATAVGLGGTLLLALLQGGATLFAVLPLGTRRAFEGPAPLILGLLALTTLPWFTVFVMPDIFAAVIIAYGAVLWRAFDALSPRHRVLLMLVASFAALSHYGHPPLALGLYGLVLLGRLAQRRLGPGVVLAAAIPVLVSPLANLGATALVTDTSGPGGAGVSTPSMAPKRLPILLARSIQDGPAAWYLAEACPDGAELAICTAFEGDVPDDITTFLWSEDGIKSLSEAEMQAVRNEEIPLLWDVFRAYPAAQTLSLTRNAARQSVLVGLDKFEVMSAIGAEAVTDPAAPAIRLIDRFDRIVDWSTVAGAIALLGLTLHRRDRIGPVAIVLAGLALNAVIFGGLSAPDDRYQARVVWLLPALALLFAADDLSRRYPVPDSRANHRKGMP